MSHGIAWTPDPKGPHEGYVATRANALVLMVLVAIFALVGILTWDRFNAARSAREWSQHSYDVLGP